MFDRCLEPKWPKIDPKTIRNRSKNRSRIQFCVLRIFNQFWAPQTSKNIKTTKEHQCVSRVKLFHIDQNLDQKTFKNDIQNRSKFNQKSIKQMIWKIIRFLSKKNPTSDPQRAPKIVPKSILGPPWAPRWAPDAPRGLQRPNLDDFLLILDSFWTDFWPFFDRISTEIAPNLDQISMKLWIDLRSFLFWFGTGL